jgi:hypothetical protein
MKYVFNDYKGPRAGVHEKNKKKSNQIRLRKTNEAPHGFASMMSILP